MNKDFETIPLTPMRQAIATRMMEAKRTIPHFRLAADIEVDALIELRRDLLERCPDVKLSINDLLIKACAIALMEVPAVNIQWADKEIRQYATADISVVIALQSGGLSTPIIRRAQSKSLWEIARELRELAARAARNALRMDQILGGSFSISNLGMYGVDQFDAIVNPPQCAILAVGAAKLQVVVSPERATRIATVMRVTLSCDHRAIDGATGASFLSTLRTQLEQPNQLRPEAGG